MEDSTAKERNQSRDELLDKVQFLVARLERLSADSHWAHYASGLRGALLRRLIQLENSDPFDDAPVETQELEKLLDRGYQLLIRAAREIHVPDDYAQ